VPLVVGMLGLGEAGGTLRADLRAIDGVTVRGYDPIAATAPDVAAAADAARGADVVVSLVTAAQADAALRSVLDVLADGQLYADLNTSGAGLKRELARLVAPTGAAFADVALMAPVPGSGLRTPMLASGGGADAFVRTFAALGADVQYGGPDPGDAAQRKLLRSVLWKGVSAVVLEALAAARAADCEPWMRDQIVTLFEGADGALADRMETGSRTHAARRMHEMEDVAAQLRELGVQPRVSEASVAWLRDLMLEEAGDDALADP
jgi:3-hydroxyisobutyrate dehydrogenase-like beta-hydroxyacid dehydrogenase